MRKIIERCPACAGELTITRLTCPACETEVSGRFSTTVFDRLSPESLAFVETFVRLRGNIKEMERELGVPYSAVRSRLDDVISELGFESDARPEEAPAPAPAPSPTPEPAPGQPDRQDILDRVDRGELTVAEAVEQLSRLE